MQLGIRSAVMYVRSQMRHGSAFDDDDDDEEDEGTLCGIPAG